MRLGLWSLIGFLVASPSACSSAGAQTCNRQAFEPCQACHALAVGAGSTNLGHIVAQTLSHPGAVINPGHLLGFALGWRAGFLGVVMGSHG
mgnify:CR=1 FL=1